MIKKIKDFIFGKNFDNIDIKNLESYVNKNMFDMFNIPYEFLTKSGSVEYVTFYSSSVEVLKGDLVIQLRSIYNDHKYSLYITKYTDLSNPLVFFLDTDGVSKHEIKKRGSLNSMEDVFLCVKKNESTHLINKSISILKEIRKYNGQEI